MILDIEDNKELKYTAIHIFSKQLYIKGQIFD